MGVSLGYHDPEDPGWVKSTLGPLVCVYIHQPGQCPSYPGGRVKSGAADSLLSRLLPQGLYSLVL